jgi:hypothetical protein
VTRTTREVQNKLLNNPLSDEEFTALFKCSVPKLIFNIILLILGIILVTISVVALILDWAFYVSLITVTIGLWWIGRFSLKPTKIREKQPYIPTKKSLREPRLTSTEINTVTTRSFPASRLIAGVTMLVMSIIYSNVYGLGMGENNVGNWFTLNGLTLWYPLGGIPFIAGFGLIFYFIISKKWIRFSRSEHLFVIEEFAFAPLITEIPRKEVRAIQFINNYSGSKYLWIIILGMQIVWVLVDGFSFLLNPFAFGNGIFAGIAYVITGIIQFVLLIYLLISRETELLIITNEKRYQLVFSPPGSKGKIQNAILNLFEMVPEVSRNGEQTQFNDIKLQSAQIREYSNIIAGIFFIILACISITFRFYAGDAFRMILFLSGIYLLVKGFKHDFLSKKAQMRLGYDGMRIYFHRKSFWMHESNRIDATSGEFKIVIRPVRLQFFDIILMIAIPFIIGITLAGFYRFVPMESTVWYIGVGYIIISSILLTIVTHILIHPLTSLIIKTPSIQTVINFPSITTSDAEPGRGRGKGVVGSIFENYIDIWRNQKKTVILRMIMILGALLLGIVYSLFV